MISYHKAPYAFGSGDHNLFHAFGGRDADLMVMVNCQIPSDDLVVHFF